MFFVDIIIKKLRTMRAIFNLIVLLLFVSCSQEYEKEPEFKSLQLGNQHTLLSCGKEQTNWEDDLNYSFNGAGKDSLQCSSLEMIEYSLLKDSTILGHQAIKEIIADSMFIPIYGDSINVNRFKLWSFLELNSMFNVNAKSLYMTKKMDILREYLNEQLKIVKIKWRYNKNEYFETKCLVTDEQMVYDDILSNIRYITIEVPANNKTFSRKIVKTRGGDPGYDKYPISYDKMSSTYVCYASNHTVGAIAYYYVQVSGTRYPDGTKSIDYAQYEAPHDSKPGFYAAGQIQAEVEYGKNGTFSYNYAVGVGTKEITISMNGSSFTMYGEDSGAVGGEGFSANALD